MSSDLSREWFDGFFEEEWLDHLSAGSSPEATERQVDFLVERLDLRAGTRVLDLACGRGRIAIPLARRGCRVTGVDLSPRSLELAERDAQAAGVELDLERRDMRELDAVERYEAVLNVWSSFGYFAEQADDERVLAAVARALVPGGRFFLDTINPVTHPGGFVPMEWRELDDGTLLLERRSYDQLSGRSNASWRFVRADGSRAELRFSVRAYTAAELVRMLAAAGLELDGSWGGWDGSDLGAGHRILLRARKPA